MGCGHRGLCWSDWLCVCEVALLIAVVMVGMRVASGKEDFV